MRKLLLAVAATALSACGSGSPGAVTASEPASLTTDPARAATVANGDVPLAPRRPKRPTSAIAYHDGGAVLAGTSHVYFLWYGLWNDGNAGQRSVLRDLVSTLGGSAYWSAVTGYAAGGVAPANALQYGGELYDDYSVGATLTRSDAVMAVTQAIASGQLPLDTAGIYVLVGAPDVSIAGFCSTTCAAHTESIVNDLEVRIALLGHPSRCPSQCVPAALAGTSGPSGISGADALAFLLAATLANTVTDPALRSWFDTRGGEMASRCAWLPTATFTSGNGAPANVTLGTQDHLLPPLWRLDPSLRLGGRCGLSP